MNAIVIAGTVICRKDQAKRLISRLNAYFEESPSIYLALAIDDYTERLINAGFLRWDEIG